MSKRTTALILAIAAINALVTVNAGRAYAQCGQMGSRPCSGGPRDDQPRRPTNTPLPSETAIAIQPFLMLPGTAATFGASPEWDPSLQTVAAQTQMALTPSATATPPITATETNSALGIIGSPAAAPVTGDGFTIPANAVWIMIAALVALVIAAALLRASLLRKRNKSDENSETH